MIRNYFLAAIRNLSRTRIYTLINIAGLGVAIAICTVAFFNQMFSYQFDRQNENYNEIYRINSFVDMGGREQEYGVVPATLGLQIRNDIPGIERSARIARSGSPVKIGDELFQSQVSYVDPDFLDIFTIPIVYGEKSVIGNNGNVLISQELAHKLFGDEYPVGKSISIINDNSKEFTYTVGAVFKDLPLNCSFRMDIVTNFDNFLLMWNMNDADWKFMTTAIFIQLPDESLVPAVTKQLDGYVEVENSARRDFKINRWKLIPLSEVGDNTRMTWNPGLFPAMHPAAVDTPPVMAIFILLLACFNFANTSMATFSRRLKEIGLRKTFGAHRKQLVQQFMLETFIVCFISLLVGIALAEWLVPAYGSLWSYMSLELTFTEYPVFWIFLFVLLLLTGFLSGVYPALYVSRFNPVTVIKGLTRFSGSGKLSVILLILQFTISFIALTVGVIFERNARFQVTVDRGYDNRNIIAMQLPPANFTSFRNALLQDPRIIKAEGTQQHIEWSSSRGPIKNDMQQIEVSFMNVGPEYLNTMGVRLIDGRLFDQSRAEADRSNGSVVINKTLADQFGWKDPVGMTFTFRDTIKYSVIGVVEDFYNNGMWSKIMPTVLRLTANDVYYNIVVRGEEEDLPGILELMKTRWKEQGTNYVFGALFQEEIIQEERSINGSILKINIFLAVAATILSLIGMYNMVSLDMIKKTKEMGIRKIQGASLPILMYLMSRKFLLVIGISTIAGCTAGYILSDMLLDSIWDYYVDITPGMILFSAFVMISATIATISYKIISSALKNPVVSLRYE
ncbi:MAG TPA: ABC transporter permease [Bacteroidales bacterium]|nr:ABC transporter permease [Bacteroidales bacterium]